MSILQMLFHREVDYATSGGTKLEPGNGYLYHVFTDIQSAQNFTLAKIPNETVNIDYIVIAGGGGGGAAWRRLPAVFPGRGRLGLERLIHEPRMSS